MKKGLYYKFSFITSLVRSRNAIIGCIIVLLFLICAVFSPIISSENPYDYVVNLDKKELAPSFENPFGTDSLGRDIFSRVIYGTRISLKVGIMAMTISLVIGIMLGSLSGYFGGFIDMIIMRITDIFMALPAALLALAVMAIFENPSVNKIFIVLGISLLFVSGTTITLLGWTTQGWACLFNERFHYREVGYFIRENSDQKTVIYGLNEKDSYKIMFYSDRTALPGHPSSDRINELKLRGYDVLLILDSSELLFNANLVYSERSSIFLYRL